MKVFIEEQRFNQWWFRALMLLTIAIVAASLILSYEEIKEDVSSIYVTIIASIITVFAIVFVAAILKLKTRIDELGVHYGFWPFMFKMKTIAWNEIEDCHVRTYSPLTEYGGWGYRAGFRGKSAAVNVRGNIGVQIVFKNGKRLLIGTQNEEDAKKVLETYKHKI